MYRYGKFLTAGDILFPNCDKIYLFLFLIQRFYLCRHRDWHILLSPLVSPITTVQLILSATFFTSAPRHRPPLHPSLLNGPPLTPCWHFQNQRLTSLRIIATPWPFFCPFQYPLLTAPLFIYPASSPDPISLFCPSNIIRSSISPHPPILYSFLTLPTSLPHRSPLRLPSSSLHSTHLFDTSNIPSISIPHHLPTLYPLLSLPTSPPRCPSLYLPLLIDPPEASFWAFQHHPFI